MGRRCRRGAHGTETPSPPRGLGPRWSGPQGRGPRTGREEGRARLQGFPRSGSRRCQKRKGGAGGQRGAPLGRRPGAPGGPRAIQRPLARTRPDGDQSEEADDGASPVSSPPPPGCVTRGRPAEATHPASCTCPRSPWKQPLPRPQTAGKTATAQVFPGRFFSGVYQVQQGFLIISKIV